MIVVVDTETSGLDPKSDAIVELAAVTLLQSPEGAWQLGPHASSLVAPGRRMHPAAQAQHHLTDEMLRDAPKLPWAALNVMQPVAYDPKLDCLAYDKITCIAAHNASFDRPFLFSTFNNLKIPDKWLCTFRAAKHIWPDAPSYSNQTLRYFVPKLDKEIREHLPEGLVPHRALYDALCTGFLLKRMLQYFSIKELLDIQNKPVLMNKISFGKHKDSSWEKVSTDYLNWILRANPPFDVDIRYTASHYIEKRNGR